MKKILQPMIDGGSFLLILIILFLIFGTGRRRR